MKQRSDPPSPVLAVHGGAGTIARDRMTERREREYRAALTAALRAGYAVLEDGGASIDAVVAAVVVLEDTPLFNAGRGAVFNANGRHELDAAVMDGGTCNAGAVAAVRRTKNPVLAARAVMERTPHVLLVGAAADRFARAAGLAMVPPRYFSTAAREVALARARAHAAATAADRHGTVGAVALDRAGNLAAATSTGGYTAKMAGRVGDSPLVGAGTYADNAACAVSGTGSGEHFMRAVLAYDVSARMRYRGETLETAARSALARVTALGGDGGLIAVDRSGNVAMPFVSEGMYRGWAIAGRLKVAIYRQG
ncbi:MAG TPA: isoaspartyl peptidase/L-asparaginase [Burkholderiales bacterium]|nr:isoaspartyl peptidase/L-asparaginase [Burkholderiales bacterium]